MPAPSTSPAPRSAATAPSAEGGGLWNSAAGTFTVTGSEVVGNTAGGNDADQGGGGLYNDGGTLTVRDSVVSENTATGTAGSGGGLLNKGTLEVTGTTFDANTSVRAGGAIETTDATTVTLRDVVLTGNDTGASPGNGGGLHITAAGVVTYDGGPSPATTPTTRAAACGTAPPAC